MADLAREEADRYFNQRTTHPSHPEDRDNSHSDSSENEQDISEPAFQSDSLYDNSDDEDISNSMSTLSTSKKTYHVPTQVSYANTGPKGVIADAQSYARARQTSTRRQPTSTYTNHHPTPPPIKEKDHSSDQEETSSLSSTEEDDDNDKELMTQWRANRLAELSSQTHQNQDKTQTQTHNKPLRRVSPSRRKFGHTTLVDASGYLDAIEHTHPLTTVVVMLYDLNSPYSHEVEDELDSLAEKYDSVRFVKMDHEIAEMEYLNIPAVLGYRGGELFGTVGGARREGLERVLIRQGFFVE